MSIGSRFIILGLVLTACDHPAESYGDEVDERRPGSPTLTPPSERQGDTVGGADSFPAKTVGSRLEGCELSLDPTTPDSGAADHLVATIHGTADHRDVGGTVHVRRVSGGIAVEALADGLPAGEYTLQLHTYGNCTDPQQNSAGPELAVLEGGEAGKLGVLTTTASGTAEIRLPAVKLPPGQLGLVNGRAVVLHAAGDQGKAVACGVLGIAKQSEPRPTPTAIVHP